MLNRIAVANNNAKIPCKLFKNVESISVFLWLLNGNRKLDVDIREVEGTPSKTPIIQEINNIDKKSKISKNKIKYLEAPLILYTPTNWTRFV